MHIEPRRRATADCLESTRRTAIPRDFWMGEWRVQPSLGRLGRAGVEIRLRPQLMDVLCCLAARPGHTIGRDELFNTVWPGQFVAETGLPRCIAELRQVFHDDARQPTVIETIPKRGYRLLLPVAWVLDGGAGSASVAADAGRASRPEPVPGSGLREPGARKAEAPSPVEEHGGWRWDRIWLAGRFLRAWARSGGQRDARVPRAWPGHVAASPRPDNRPVTES